MANFNLQMTGAQVKDALNQLINRVAEGWAVGTKDGNPVGSGSPYYQNNAKYYAASAQGSAARAEAAVPASTAGAVFFDRSQTLTDAQKATARNNIGASAGGGGGNNLFDNAWFLVNQRQVGTATVSAATYTRDRWKVARGTYIFNDDGTVTTKWDGTGSGVYLIQYVAPDIAQFIAGKNATISAYINGTLRAKTVTIPATSGGGTSESLGNGVTINVTNQTGTNRGIEVQFVHALTGGRKIGPVKMELGSSSSLDKDVPPTYQEELAKCLYYFERIYAGNNANLTVANVVGNSSGTYANGYFKVAPKRQIPTVTFSGSLKIGGASPTINVTGININGYSPNGSLQISAAATCTTGEMYRFIIMAGGYIDLACEP